MRIIDANLRKRRFLYPPPPARDNINKPSSSRVHGENQKFFLRNIYPTMNISAVPFISGRALASKDFSRFIIFYCQIVKKVDFT